MSDQHRILLRRMRRGSPGAARRLWRDLSPGLLAHARTILSDADADDAVQQAFCAILDLDRAGAREIADVRAWLHHVMRTRALNMLRSERRRRDRERGRSTPRSLAPSFSSAEIADLVESLPVEQREVIVLRAHAGLTFEQIAIATGTPRSTLASRHRSALDALRAALADRSGPDRPPAEARDSAAPGSSHTSNHTTLEALNAARASRAAAAREGGICHG